MRESEAIADYSLHPQLRFLFASLLLHLDSSKTSVPITCSITTHNDATDRALLDIGRHLSNRGLSLSVHGLPEPERGLYDNEVNLELDFFHPRRRAAADTAYESDQGRIFDTILERLEDPNGGLLRRRPCL